MLMIPQVYHYGGAGLHREYRQVSLSPNMDHGLG